MSFTPVPIETVVNSSHFLNALSPIDSTVFGMTIDLSCLLNANDPCVMTVTNDGIVNFTANYGTFSNQTLLYHAVS